MKAKVVRFALISAVAFLSTFILSADGLETIVIREEPPENCEQQTKDGDYLVISYVGKYKDDQEQFDASETKDDPFYFKLGEGKVWPAWERALKHMCVGEKREIFIPANELEGDQVLLPGIVVPDLTRTVSYSVELIKILEKPPTPNLFKKMDFDGDNLISKTEMKAFFSAQGLGGLEDDESMDSAVDNIFGFQDVNEDNFISYEEFPGEKHDEL